MSEAENQSGSRAGGLERNEAVVVAAVAAADGNGVDNVTDNGAGGASVAITTEDSGENRPFQARNGCVHGIVFLSYRFFSLSHRIVSHQFYYSYLGISQQADRGAILSESETSRE